MVLLSGCGLIKGPPKDGECRANLRTIASLELGHFEVTNTFSPHPAQVGFAPASGNRYLYLFAPDGGVTRRDGKPSPPPLESVGIGPDPSRGSTVEWLLERMPPEVAAELGVHGACPDCSITIGCVGNIDDDDYVDVWSISTVERRDGAGFAIPQGTAYRHRNDREH